MVNPNVVEQDYAFRKDLDSNKGNTLGKIGNYNKM